MATLYFGIDVKISTPTSVMIMGIQSVIGVLIKFFFFQSIHTQAIQYWAVCLPIVIFGAPLGAFFIINKTKDFLIKFLQISIIIQFIFSWYILPLDLEHKIWSIFLIVFSFSLYFWLARRSLYRSTKNSR